MADLLVDPNGSFTSIQAAIDAAQSGDTILVAAGTYDENITITKSLTLLSLDGPDSTIIAGLTSGPGNSTVQIAAGVDNVVIGSPDHGFHIIGFDRGNPAVENPTVALLGNSTGFELHNNHITANGDAALVSPWNAAVIDAVIDGNTFDGQTFIGTPNSGDQFTVPNVPRQLIAFGQGSDPATNLADNIAFTNNTVSGTAGSLTGSSGPVGDNLVTIDADNSTIADNTFDGFTIDGRFDFRTRGNDVDVHDNTVDHSANNSGGNGFSIQGTPGDDSGNELIGGSGKDLLVGTPGNDTLDGGDGDDTLMGGGGADHLTGGAGNDALAGGGGTDTAHYTDVLSANNFHYDAGTDSWTVTTATEGTDTLTGMEIVQGADPAGPASGKFLLVDPNGSFTSIQAAIDAAQEGDTILVAAGTYNENLVIDKGVTILGIEPGVVIHGTFQSANGMPGTVYDFLKTAPGYAGDTGVTIAADNVTLENLTIASFMHGIDLGDGVDHIVIKDVDVTGFDIGLHKGPTSDVHDLTVTGGSFSDGYLGVNFEKTTDPLLSGDGLADGIVFSDLTFSDILQKGIYVEALSHAELTDLTMTNVGQWGGVPSHGADGANGNGININLKNGDYTDIDIGNFHMTDVGSSDKEGGAASHQNGGAIVVSARDDGATYGAAPATATNVTIHDGTIDGHLSTGIEVGERGRDNAGPDVTVTNVAIDGAQHGVQHGDLGNQSQGTMTVTGTAGDDSLVASTASDGAFDIDGGDGNDTIAGGSAADHLKGGSGNDIIEGREGNDHLTGGAGNDQLHGGSGTDTAHYAEALSASNFHYDDAMDTWTVTTATEGTDTLAGMEIVQGADPDGAGGASGKFLLVDPHGSFTSIQAAIDAAQDGDTILVAAGTYTGDVTVDKSVTILGANHGIGGTGARGAESVIAGHVTVTAAGAVDIDGVQIENTSDNTVQFVGVKVSTSGDVTVQNSVFHSPVVNGSQDDRAILLDTTATGHVTIADNLITGDAVGKFGADASWHRGIWSDGATSQLDITGNTFENVRSAINLDGYDDGVTQVSGNAFVTGGTGISIGTPVGSEITGIHDNTFTDIDSDFNLRNVTTGQTFDLDATNNTALAGGTDATGTMYVMGGADADTLTGTAGDDVLDARDLFGGLGDTAANVLSGLGGNDLLLGSAGNDTLDGGDGDDTLMGGGGADHLTGGAGNDALAGGGGTDTAHYTDVLSANNFHYDAGTDSWTVTTATEGTDTLTGMEIVQGADPAGPASGKFLLVDSNGSFTSIQAAIDAAQEGDTILVAAGTYNENLVIDKGVTILGIEPGVVIHGTFQSANGMSGTVYDFLKTAPGYAGDTGVTIAADNVTLENLTIASFMHGIDLGDGVDHIVIKDVDVTGFDIGLHKGPTSDVHDLTVTGGSFSDGYLGVNFEKTTDPLLSGDGLADGIVFSDLTFSDILQKGIYVEALSHAELTDLTMTNVGQWGGVPSHGADGANGNGININLKNGDYTDIDIGNFHMTDVGSSDKEGGAASHQNGGAIVVSARDDGATYGAAPATATNVTIHDGTIDGHLSTGIEVGERGRDNAGPDVTVTNVEIDGAQHGVQHGDIGNQSQGTVTVTGTAGDDSLVASTASDGAFDIDGGDGNDTIAGGSAADHLKGGSGNDVIDGREGNDHLTGGAGNDQLHGGDGFDTAHYDDPISHYTVTYTRDANGIVTSFETVTENGPITGVDEGHDDLTSIEALQFGDTTLTLGKPVQLFNTSNALVGTFDTIQGAIDASADGYTVLVSAGTYAENLTIDNGVTIRGIGTVTVDPASGNVVTIAGDLGGANVSLQNLVLDGSISAPNQGIGVDVETHAHVGTLTLDHVTVQNNGAYGLFANGDQFGDAVADLVVTSSTFDHNGFNGTNGSGHIKLFGFTGDATLTNVTIHGAGDPTPEAGRPDYAIEFHGIPNGALGVVAPPAMGEVDITGVVVDGLFHKNALAVNNYANVDDLSISGLDISQVRTIWGPVFNFDGILGNIDSTGYGVIYPTGANLPADGIVAQLQGDHAPEAASAQTIAGTDNAEMLRGGSRADNLFGRGGNDLLLGEGGNDYIEGGAGNDVAYGDEGDDIILGGDGNDALYGGGGNDVLAGEAGDDFIDGGDGSDTIFGGDGNDIIHGGAGGDYIEGGTGNDIIYGDAGDDVLRGLDGSDALYGGDGSDVLTGDGGNDYLDGGAGNDTILAGDGIDIAYGGDGDDYIEGNGGNDFLYGGAQNDVLLGGDGVDILYGGDGNDVLSGDAGNDLLFGEAGDDTVFGGDGVDTIYGGTGNDYIEGNSGNDIIYGEDGRDTILGGDNDDLVYGGDGNDYIEGNAGNDTLFGDAGNDTLVGGDGNDTLVGGDGDDVILGEGGADIIFGDAGNDTLIGGSNADVLYGGIGDDYLEGDTGNDTLYGGDGNDTIDGGEDDDTVFGGSGNDVIVGGSGNDTLYGEDGTDTIISGDGNDLVYGGAGNDYIEGNGGRDTIYGEAGDDIILGGDGNDVLSGGAGNDFVMGDAGNDLLYGGNDNDTLIGGDGNDTLYGDAGADFLQGDAGADILYGGDGNDTLNGGAGADILYGGAGKDLFVFARGEAQGDTVADFLGFESGGGDMLIFSGYGLASQGATFTPIDGTHWSINSADGSVHEIITLLNQPSVGPVDFAFVV